MLEPGRYRNASANPTWITFFFVSSQGMLYEKPQYDPVFPGFLPLPSPDTNQTMYGVGPQDSLTPIAYANYDPRPTIIGCVDDVYIRSSQLGRCVEGLKNYDDPYLGDKTKAASRFEDSQASELEILHFFLSHVILDKIKGGNVDPEEFYVYSRAQEMVQAYLASSRYIPHTRDGFSIYHNLPQDHWKEIVRQDFEAYLASLQFRVLDIARGDKTCHGKRIPKRLRGICNMGKFHSVGWRNVSVWGLFGLLSLSALVALASVETEHGDLWITVGVRILIRSLRCTLHKIGRISWRVILARAMLFLHSPIYLGIRYLADFLQR